MYTPRALRWRLLMREKNRGRWGWVPNQAEGVRKLIARLGPADRLRVCYEAGQCGFVLYWQLQQMGVHCSVIAPSLIPRRSGERVKTDRLDALRLVRSYRAGELVAVLVPSKEQEALRDLLRAIYSAKGDQIRHVHRLAKFLLRQGRCKPPGVGLLSTKYLAWARAQQFAQPAQREVLNHYVLEFEHSSQRSELTKALDEVCEQLAKPTAALVAALQGLRGVAKLLALSLVSELGNLSRFRNPRPLMSYAGVVSREHSSGNTIRRGAITKSGRGHLRRMIVEAAWHYRHRPGLGQALAKRQAGLSEEVRAIAWKAQLRLTRRYRQLVLRGKPKPQVIVAVARELLGFIWAIGMRVEEERKLVLVAQPLARNKDPGRRAASRPDSRLRVSRPQPPRSAITAPSSRG